MVKQRRLDLPTIDRARDLFYQGKTLKQIAKELSISFSSVFRHSRLGQWQRHPEYIRNKFPPRSYPRMSVSNKPLACSFENTTLIRCADKQENFIRTCRKVMMILADGRDL